MRLATIKMKGKEIAGIMVQEPRVLTYSSALARCWLQLMRLKM